jgi:hypothetical protein
MLNWFGSMFLIVVLYIIFPVLSGLIILYLKKRFQKAISGKVYTQKLLVYALIYFLLFCPIASFALILGALGIVNLATTLFHELGAFLWAISVLITAVVIVVTSIEGLLTSLKEIRKLPRTENFF